ncbi:cingulin-like isoform X3 [Dreissena polymorpha]|nr:cingulin-like isoform X3 [Dreissena polymorpha]
MNYTKLETPDSTNRALVQKMFQLEAAYRDINDKEQDIMKYKMNSAREADAERDREMAKIKFQAQRLEERLNVARVETENAKRELKNAQDGRAVVDKKLKAMSKENADLKNNVSQLRVKLGVANANYNVGKHEAESLRKNHQDSQIMIARLEERLNAANQELERLRNPANPEGSEEVKKKLTTEKKDLKRLRAEVARLEETLEHEQKRFRELEEEHKIIQDDVMRQRHLLSDMQTALEMAEMTLQAERASREDYEKQNHQLRMEREHFEDTLKEYKVKLGISLASKNVNVRHAELLKKKDEEYQYTIQNLEKRLKISQTEIEKLKSRAMLTGKTADSLQEHKSRLKKYRNGFSMEFITPRSFDKLNPNSSGWTPTRGSPKGSHDRISVGSTGSITKTQPPQIKSKSGRVSLP